MPRAGAGMGELGKLEIGVTLKKCGFLCDGINDCNAIEFRKGRYCKQNSINCVEIPNNCSLKRNIGSTTKPLMDYTLCQNGNNSC